MASMNEITTQRTRMTHNPGTPNFSTSSGACSAVAPPVRRRREGCLGGAVVDLLVAHARAGEGLPADHLERRLGHTAAGLFLRLDGGASPQTGLRLTVVAWSGSAQEVYSALRRRSDWETWPLSRWSSIVRFSSAASRTGTWWGGALSTCTR